MKILFYSNHKQYKKLYLKYLSGNGIKEKDVREFDALLRLLDSIYLERKVQSRKSLIYDLHSISLTIKVKSKESKFINSFNLFSLNEFHKIRQLIQKQKIVFNESQRQLFQRGFANLLINIKESLLLQFKVHIKSKNNTFNQPRNSIRAMTPHPDDPEGFGDSWNPLRDLGDKFIRDLEESLISDINDNSQNDPCSLLTLMGVLDISQRESFAYIPVLVNQRWGCIGQEITMRMNPEVDENTFSLSIPSESGESIYQGSELTISRISDQTEIRFLIKEQTKPGICRFSGAYDTFGHNICSGHQIVKTKISFPWSGETPGLKTYYIVTDPNYLSNYPYNLTFKLILIFYTEVVRFDMKIVQGASEYTLPFVKEYVELEGETTITITEIPDEIRFASNLNFFYQTQNSCTTHSGNFSIKRFSPINYQIEAVQLNPNKTIAYNLDEFNNKVFLSDEKVFISYTIGNSEYFDHVRISIENNSNGVVNNLGVFNEINLTRIEIPTTETDNTYKLIIQEFYNYPHSTESYEYIKEFRIKEAPNFLILLSNGGFSGGPDYSEMEDGYISGRSSNLSGNKNCPIEYTTQTEHVKGNLIHSENCEYMNYDTGSICSILMNAGEKIYELDDTNHSLNFDGIFNSKGSPMNVLGHNLYAELKASSLKTIWDDRYLSDLEETNIHSSDIEIVVGWFSNDKDSHGFTTWNELIQDHEDKHLIMVGSSHGGANFIQLLNDWNSNWVSTVDAFISWDSTDGKDLSYTGLIVGAILGGVVGAGIGFVADNIQGGEDDEYQNLAEGCPYIPRILNFWQQNPREEPYQSGGRLSFPVSSIPASSPLPEIENVNLTGCMGHTAISKSNEVHKKTIDVIKDVINSIRDKYRE